MTTVRSAFACVSRRFYGVAHDVFDQTPAFLHVCQHEYIDIVERFLADARANPAAKNSEAIQLSSWHGHADVVKLLLADGGAAPEAGDSFAIKLSSQNGHGEVVRLLLADGRADPTACMRTW